MIYKRSEQRIYFGDKSWECRSDFFPGENELGQARESLPNGTYTCVAEEPPAENSNEYGTFYISTGDYRGRDIHGGGSGLDNPKDDYQGWYPTLGCLRCQNADGQELSRLIIDSGNNVELEVVD